MLEINRKHNNVSVYTQAPVPGNNKHESWWQQFEEGIKKFIAEIDKDFSALSSDAKKDDIGNLFMHLFSGIKKFVSMVAWAVEKGVGAAEKIISKYASEIKKVLNKLITMIKKALPMIKKALQLVSGIIPEAKAVIGIINTILGQIKGALTSLKLTTNTIDSVLKAIEEFSRKVLAMLQANLQLQQNNKTKAIA